VHPVLTAEDASYILSFFSAELFWLGLERNDDSKIWSWTRTGETVASNGVWNVGQPNGYLGEYKAEVCGYIDRGAEKAASDDYCRNFYNVVCQLY